METRTRKIFCSSPPTSFFLFLGNDAIEWENILIPDLVFGLAAHQQGMEQAPGPLHQLFAGVEELWQLHVVA